MRLPKKLPERYKTFIKEAVKQVLCFHPIFDISPCRIGGHAATDYTGIRDIIYAQVGLKSATITNPKSVITVPQ